MNVLHVAQILAHVTGLVNQHLLLKNEYLVAENRILRSHLPKRLRLSDEERSTLAEIGKRLGRKLLDQIALVAKPDTILAWYRRLVAKKFDGSKARTYPGRPPVAPDVVKLVVQMARENPSWAGILESEHIPVSRLFSAPLNEHDLLCSSHPNCRCKRSGMSRSKSCAPGGMHTAHGTSRGWSEDRQRRTSFCCASSSANDVRPSDPVRK